MGVVDGHRECTGIRCGWPAVAADSWARTCFLFCCCPAGLPAPCPPGGIVRGAAVASGRGSATASLARLLALAGALWLAGLAGWLAGWLAACLVDSRSGSRQCLRLASLAGTLAT